MGEGSLSQEEIDALLAGASDSFDSGVVASSATQKEVPGMSPVDRDILSDLLSSCFQVAGNTLGAVLSRSSAFLNPNVETKSRKDVESELKSGSFLLCSTLSGSVNGRIVLVMSAENAVKIANSMMGGFESGELDEAQIQTLRDSLTPVMGALISQISTKTGGGVNGSPSETRNVTSPAALVLPDGETMVRVFFNLTIENIPSFRVQFLLSLSTASDLLNLYRRSGSVGGDMSNMGMGGMGMGASPGSMSVKSVAFPNLGTASGASNTPNLNLLMDVQMSVTVELGRTKMYIKDILGLGEGSIIELDKLAGEPVDLLVNGKLIAKGEVVVIDENFGVRVTDIVSPIDRIKPEGK
ncbi:flagellar motor switch protein FliN [Leptospira borgpetersenii]|uniref:Flagellar motor switch protein FliN n=1 Tax=Leptospira borgpetersenii serovar Hardjo-bovis (strain JB197) TaxID=355277 RepID=Q04SD0_LEPBJ|nr:flagellar motor switch protein FliN [Leptospira borgpetersenii]ABJ76190.1 Endoflagellar motor switch protein [Leptospira borgpetersenii serovar Hardjo-bovis str. JB197]AMX71360.1 endoflagellar motor switch protein [Leptospira borgpetersenii serovar Hardjo]TQE57020.1 flagellar motor switch protein FliN [Leptospira borgpetersenii]